MSEKRLDIQGLRGWAIILVLLFHFFPGYFPNGYIGVDIFEISVPDFLLWDVSRCKRSQSLSILRLSAWRLKKSRVEFPAIFFVISGFLIAMILRRSDNLDVEAFRSFYYRRIKRILPLYYLAIACILIALFLFLPSSYRSMNITSSRRAIVLISNIKKVDVDAKYEKMLLNAEDLFTHTWSLCVEMQWYLLVPLIFVVQRFATIWEKAFFTGVAIASMVFYLFVDDINSFYCVFARIWQFCCGVLALLMQDKCSTKNLPHHEKVLLLESVICEAEEQERSWEPRHPFFSVCIFSMTIGVSIIWWPLPADIFRASATCLSAIVILVGSYHQTILLSNAVAVYVGNISYALYLFHWPAYIVAKHYSEEVPSALILGVVCSVLLAIAAYHLFEKYYLEWSPQAVLSMLAILIAVCTILALQPRNIDELKFGNAAVNYSAININDAAWNMTLMQYLNYKENNPRWNIHRHECKLSERFVNTSVKPLGFCSKKDGPGKYDFLVLGNSFACNQGDMVYNSFKKHARKFNIFCLRACEVMTETSSEFCSVRVNYTAILEELKPDVVFLISRGLTTRRMFNITIPLDEDPIFQDQLKRMAELESIAKKVYILQALPSCRKSCSLRAQDFTRSGRPLREIEEELIVRDAFFSRERISELGRRCRKCEVFDYLPWLVDKYGHYRGYNPDNNLMYLDNSNHFNRFGKQRLQPLFNRLAAEFEISE